MVDSKPAQESSSTPQVFVLRWGHRPQRDVRLTTHVALTSRALCASGFILSDVEDPSIEETVRKITDRWGGTFHFEMGTPWKKAIRDWKAKAGAIVHLTAYGENIQSSDVLSRIRSSGKDILIVVGSQKVPKDFYFSDVSDFNVSIGNQPHSECAAVAVFLDRFFMGEELTRNFEKAKMKIIPKARGKEIKSDVE
jgi:tRNA (cytidine56-2'-O)-methyltransferase